MPGNSQRRGAMRSGSKKGATVGSGGQRRRALQGRGPTPKAEDRTGHVRARRTAAPREDRAVGAGTERARTASQRPGPQRPGPSRSRSTGEASELVAGRNSVVEALREQVPATTLYVAARIEMDERIRESLKLAVARGLPLLEVGRPELDRLAAGALHQGIALQVPPYSYAHPDDLLARAHDLDETPLVVALDGVTDPRNLGAVVRSTSAFGGHGVVVPERRAAGMTASAWKSSAGTAARTPVARATNLTRALQAYRDAGLFVVGLDSGGDVPLDELELVTSPLVLVVGAEGKGLSRLVRETCDAVTSIPMASGTESLNAGVAAGVALYEIARRRRLA